MALLSVRAGLAPDAGHSCDDVVTVKRVDFAAGAVDELVAGDIDGEVDPDARWRPFFSLAFFCYRRWVARMGPWRASPSLVDLFCARFSIQRLTHEPARGISTIARPHPPAMTDIAPLLGVLAGAIGVADTIPYVRDILRGPHPPAPRDVARSGASWPSRSASPNEPTAPRGA